MSCLRSTAPIWVLTILFCIFLLAVPSTGTPIKVVDDAEHGGVLPWEIAKRSLQEQTAENSSLILAAERTRRRDPLNSFKKYTGGWNISNQHYWASVAFTAAPFFVVAGVWFIIFGLSLFLICMCYCCCPRPPYGYSRLAYALSLILLIFFTISAIVGCVVLYTGQGKFNSSTSSTLKYVVNQANFTAESLRNVSDYLSAAKKINVEAVVLPQDIQSSIDNIQKKIDSSATTLSNQTMENSKKIRDALHGVRVALIVIAAVMLFLAFIGFLLSIFGLQCLVYTLVVIGWILVTGTFILCGVFLLLHNVVADSCVAMDQWVQNPTAHTALDDILPCVDNATAQETLLRTKIVTYQAVNILDKVINNITNRNFPPRMRPLYYNQSGPLMPLICNPFHANYTDRQCERGEVELSNAREVMKNHTCEVSDAGICVTTGRITPDIYGQMAAAVNVSYGLYRYGPFLADLQSCDFVRQTFSDISRGYCPGLRRYTQWIYIGLLLVSAAVMLSLVFWVIYARERRHRVYTKEYNATHHVDK